MPPLGKRVLLSVGALVLVAATGVVIWQPWSARPNPAGLSNISTTTTPSPPPTGAESATELTSYGVQADWVLAENNRAGTTRWRITGTPPTGSISGWADQVYAAAGQQVNLYVSTTAPSFHVEAYRVGYYQGAGGRLVWQSAPVPGVVQPPCPVTPGINMVSCDNWKSSLAVSITTAFPQGDYLFKLVGANNEQSYVPLTVWQPDSQGTYLIKNDVFTWQAWNPYGGYDYYQGVGPCPAGVYPLCSRARVVSYDRPYDFADAGGQGTGDFLWLEAPLVRFMEQHGLDVSYATDLTLVEHPTFLTNHKVLISLGHDECWSLEERQAAVTAYQHGMNLAFFGASAVLRHVRTQPSPIGPNRQVVDYRSATSDPLNGKGDPLQVTGNTWSSPPASWPEVGFVGAAYNGFLEPTILKNMTVVDPNAWIFAGADLTNGGVPNAIGSDVDSLQPAADYPPNVQVFAHSALPVNQAQANTRNGGTFYSDMTYYTNPTTQSGVWDSGTNNWIPALASCEDPTTCAGPALQRITGNLFNLFGQGPAGRVHPSVPNMAQVYPARP